MDAAQTAGVWPIDMERMHIDALAFTGHKGAAGASGDRRISAAGGYGPLVEPLLSGGTGASAIQSVFRISCPTALSRAR